MIKADKVNEYVNSLMANLSFKADYQSFLKKNGEKARLLIVEGTTDETFVKNVISPDVACMIARKAFMKRASFGAETREQAINYKAAIVQLVYGLSKMPQIISCKGSENWIVYGMIDLDFDDEDSNLYKKTSQLFVTDTHDLETLLLSTDSELLRRVKRCSIDEKDIKWAFSVAYQLGVMRSVLRDSDMRLDLSALAAGSTDYSCFVDDEGRISTKKLIHPNLLS